MKDLNNGLGGALKALRKSRGMTQAQVADLAGVERTSITNIEAGRQMLRVSTMNAICRALGYEVQVRFVPLKTAHEVGPEIDLGEAEAHSDHPMRCYDRTCPACNSTPNAEVSRARDE